MVRIDFKLSSDCCVEIEVEKPFELDGLWIKSGKIQKEELYSLYRFQCYYILQQMNLYGYEDDKAKYVKETSAPLIKKFLLMIMSEKEIENRREEMEKFNNEKYAREFYENVSLKILS